MDFKIKYLKYKKKYIELNNSLSYDQNKINLITNRLIGGNKINYSDSDENSEKINLIDEDQRIHDKEINKPKVNQGRGLLGDLLTGGKNTGFFGNLFKPSSWDYVEPENTQIYPDKISYTEFNQEIINKIYLHKRTQFEEGFDLGFIIGYESGVNLDYTPNKMDVPGNIPDPEFLDGFIVGWKIGFSKGKKYYYVTYIQLNNNNENFQQEKSDKLKSILSNEEIIKKSGVNYDEIESKNYDKYYVKLKKILLDKTHEEF